MKMNQQNNRPSFMNGLLQAKKILISLKQKKLKEQESLNQNLSKNFNVQTPKVCIKQQNKSIQYVKQSQIAKVEQSKKSLMIQKINKIGKELYQNYEQIESDQFIFERLAQYYSQNLRIVQQNERLKRKSYKFSELITFYKQKIEENYKIAQENKEYQENFVKMVEQGLQEYFMNEKQNSLIQVLPKLQSKIQIFSIRIPQDEHKQQEKIQISLNWKNLSQATQKKAIPKKTKAIEEDICKSFYNSQIYNI